MKPESSETSLGSRLLVAVVTPIVLLVVVGGLLTAQIIRMSETAHWVDRTDEVITRMNRLYRQIVDQETAVRGYILTGDVTFLEPFDRARPRNEFDALRLGVAESDAQKARLEDAIAAYEAWLLLSEPIAKNAVPIAEARTAASLSARKRRMDVVRSTLVDLLRGEEVLRHERSAAADASTRTTLWTGGGLFAVIGLALAFVSRRQIGGLASTYNEMLSAERSTREALEAEGWLRSRQMTLAERIRGDRTTEAVAQAAIEALATETGAAVGAFYVTNGGGGWRRCGGYALDSEAPERFADGEGLVGQVGRDKKTAHLADAPADLLRVRSGAADRRAVDLLVGAAVADGAAEAVVELGFLKKPDRRALDLVDRVSDVLAIAVRSAKYRARLKELLEESQQQAEELQAQQEELRVANEELQQQGEALRGAHAQLEERKEELEASNAGLEAQRNALERAQRDLAEKASDLARASQYKSEFLANMSHELRTPLNSTLILAKLLSDNEKGNLDEEQVRFAQTISSAGNDLLALINDILDLSKIEAGKVDVNASATTLSQLLEPVTRTFEPVATNKNVAFDVKIDPGTAGLTTDIQRAQQVVKNLLSNAFKFTEKGQVTLSARIDGSNVVIAVSDTGIGIPKEHHAAIFEAFRQADGTTNRRFGGTGLGLSISRDLAKLLGGELRLESEPGHGSTFTLVLPREVSDARPAPTTTTARPSISQASLTHASPARVVRVAPATNGAKSGAHVTDDRDGLDPRQRILLVVEDDIAFADVLASLARQLDFQFLHAATSDDGIRLAMQHQPTAIVLDVGLPDHSGLSVLDRLKRDPATRHIPVHVVSAGDHAQAALTMGAAGYLLKPVNREELVDVLKKLGERFERVRRLLVVEDDEVQRDAITRLLGADEIEIVAVPTVAEALDQLGKNTFDCVVTDLALPDATGYELLEKMAADERYSFPPVIVYTGRSLSADEEQRLRRYSSSIIVKGARSPERLLDEVTLFLHQVEASLPAERQRMLRQVRDREAVFAGRKILIAEDDVRNVFALTSVLEPKGATVVLARNGREAVEAAEKHDDIDLVLMDIMMPEMDGIAAMQEIRKRGGRLAKLPIIALTAKVMKDDQERCLAAGANDFIAKPIDVEMLLSLARVWMHA